MDRYNFKKIPPFKRYVLENFPFIEEDFDALTNWQLFCKIIKYLNDVINSQNNVGEQMEMVTNNFIELQEYVLNVENRLEKEYKDLKDWTEDYLYNLDVQEEINNKLDAMVESGEFDQYFNEYIHKLNWFYIDNTWTEQEIQTAISTPGSKVVEFETGTYNLDNIIHLVGNTTIELNGSTLNFSNNHGFFNFVNTDTPTGYNGNGNIKILNGTIKGGAISFCHAQNVEIKNINFIDITNDHVLEIAGCSNYTVDNCYFEGVAVQDSSRNYVECIQIDDMTRTNFPWFASGNNTPYDNTPNDLINIKNCTFKPDPEKSENFVIYTCIGGHTYISNNPNKNINIENCYFTGYSYAGVRPYYWKNLIIKDCTFYNDTGEDFEDEDFYSLNFKNRDCVSINIGISNMKFKNNYLYGTERFYISDNVTSTDIIEISNNIFEENNWHYELDGDNNIKVTNTDKYLYILYLQQIKKLVFNSNNFINCQKNIMRLGGMSGDKYVQITNNNFKLLNVASCFHLYTNANFFITNNYFTIDNVFDDSWKSSLQKQIFRFLTTQTNKLVFKDNLIPTLTGLSTVDLQSTNSSYQDLSNFYDRLLTLATPNSSSGTNYVTSNNRKFSDFNTLVLILGSLDTEMTNVVLTNIVPKQKLSPKTFYFDAIINASDTITGSFTIIDDTHYTFSLSNYRVKTVRCMNT